MKKTLLIVSLLAVMMMPFNVYAFDNIEKGSSGDVVKEVQEILISLGYLTGQADGQFGGMTEEAVKKYQADNEIDASGIVDEATYEKLQKSIQDYATQNAPDGMILDEEEWEAWTPGGKSKLIPFMKAGDEAGFTFTVPTGQADSDHKTVSFIFEDNDSRHTLQNVEMYYGVKDQTVDYVGLWTEDENIFKSEDFREACIRLMLGYNIHFDSDTNSAVLNLTRERVEEIVNFCFDSNVEHCLVDGMRIRVLREPDRNYYSFHMEY